MATFNINTTQEQAIKILLGLEVNSKDIKDRMQLKRVIDAIIENGKENSIIITQHLDDNKGK